MSPQAVIRNAGKTTATVRKVWMPLDRPRALVTEHNELRQQRLQCECRWLTETCAQKESRYHLSPNTCGFCKQQQAMEAESAAVMARLKGGTQYTVPQRSVNNYKLRYQRCNCCTFCRWQQQTVANLPDDWVCDCTQNQLTLREAAASMRQSTQLARAGFTFEERRREGSTYFGREAHMLKHAELHNGGPRLVPRLGRTMNQFEATAPTCLFHHHETYPSYIENPQMPPESYQDFIPPSGYHQPPKPEALPERSRPQPLGKPLGVMSPSLEEAIVEVAEGENNITESPLDFTSQTPVKPEVEVE